VKSIGERIKDLRCERGWTRRKLSELTEFSEGAIFGVETQKWIPSDRFLRAIEIAFKTKLRK